MLKAAIWFIKSSLSLDIGFLQVSAWTTSKKLEFLLKKYLEIFLLVTGFRKFKFGENYIILNGAKVFYDSPYGIAGYQSMLVRHQKMLKFANISKVKIVVDIGANVGFFSMMVRSMHPKVKIYAIEPVPKIYACLEKNLTGLHDNVFDLAISDKNGTERMLFDELESANSFVQRSDSTETLANSISSTASVVKVKANTLDKFCKDNDIKTIDILKVDTESFESNVLRGARDILSKTRYLHVEISIKDNNNYTFSQINSLLYSKDFNYQLVCFRNFADRGDGPIPVGDFFYKNLYFSKNK